MAVIGLAAAISQFVDYGQRIITRLNDFQSSVHEVPDTFKDIKIELPLLLDTLSRTKAQVQAGTINQTTLSVLMPVVEGCRFQVAELESLLVKVLPSSGDSSWQKGMKAFSSIAKEKRILKIIATLRNYVQTLTFHQATGLSRSEAGLLSRTTTLTGGDLDEQLEKLGRSLFRPQTIPPDRPATQFVYSAASFIPNVSVWGAGLLFPTLSIRTSDGKVYHARLSSRVPMEPHDWQPMNNDILFSSDLTGATASSAPDMVDLLGTAQNGKIYHTSYRWLTNQDRFQPVLWKHLAYGAAHAGAPVAITSRFDGSFDAFVIGTDFRMWRIYFKKSGTQHHWRDVAEMRFPAGAPLAVVSDDSKRLVIFGTGEDGNVYATRSKAGDDEDFECTHIAYGKASPGSKVSVLVRSEIRIDAFVVGIDKRVWTTHWNKHNDRWVLWSPIGDLKVVLGSEVSATILTTALCLFVSTEDGSIYTIGLPIDPDESSNWAQWSKASGPRVRPATPIRIVSRLDSEVSAFVVDSDDKLWGLNGSYTHSETRILSKVWDLPFGLHP